MQIVKGEYFSRTAIKQQEKYLVVYGKRGEILDRKGRVLSMDRNVYSVFINPRQVVNKEAVGRKISRVLNLDYENIFEKLQNDSYFVWLRRGFKDKSIVDILKSLNIKGVGVKVERRRIYPQEGLAAHVLGAVDIDNCGIGGVELYYNDILKGVSGYMLTLGDGKNLHLDGFGKTYMEPKDGNTLILTIDQVLQHYAEEESERLYNQYKAKRVSIVIMAPFSGEILALVNRPGYNPNAIKQNDLENMKNFAISSIFEPGSVFKVVSTATLLEEELVKLTDMVYCENGAYRMGKRILRDYRKHQWLDFKSVVVNSSNIGIAKCIAPLSKNLFYDYLKNFGVGEETGVDLPGEEPGILRNPNSWSSYSQVSIAMGQEVAVTTIGLAKIMSVIANGGYSIRPHVVSEIRDENGVRIKEMKAEALERVLSAKTVEKLKMVLREVVDDGTGKYAKSSLYSAAGKTGTAQKADLIKGGYCKDKYVASFMGFLPVENPKIVIVVTVDEPQPVHLGGVVCAPAFKNIAEKALLYLSVSERDQRAEYEINRNFIWN
ncbi:MAG: penicillin-binding protein 2 [Candidatus Saelkia tenebricola]|nr:penicillin-binding protein 2 [Candidatus Saelkia tenebricola]